jgi:folate-dependent phosphoribosylglycinamide formyltransferase PurN
MRIGLLTGKSLNSFHQECIDHISKNSSIEIGLFLIDGRKGLSKRQKLLKNWRRGRGGYMVIMFFQRNFAKRNFAKSVASFCESRGYQYCVTPDPYAVQTLDLLETQKLDVLVLLSGYGIIKQPLLRIPRMGILSYHHGDMRKYRGMPPAFWELYFNEKEMGVTVQLLSEGLDKGVPVLEKSIEICPGDTWGELKSRAMDQSVHMMSVALERLMDDNFKAEVIQNFGRIYTLPNFRQWLIFQFKIFFRRLFN